MATTVVLTSFVKEPSGKCFINFADGAQYEFESFSEIPLWATSVDRDKTLVEKMDVAYALARSPDLSNIATVRNKEFTFDLSAPAPIKVQ